LIIEHLDTVGSIIAYEDLLLVIDNNAIGKFQMLGTAKLVQDISHLIKDDDPHHLALNNDDPTLVVNCDAPWMLKDVSTKLAHKLAILVVDLYLVCWAPFCHDYVT